jgi:hypothetical protein
MLGDCDAQHDAGLYLVSLWRCTDDPNRAFFIMQAHSEEKARAFLAPASATKSRKNAGLLEFDWCFVEKEEAKTTDGILDQFFPTPSISNKS